MSNNINLILDANEAFARDFGDRAELKQQPKRQLAILTCMDARLDPLKFAGLKEGDAHIIRNGGARASDDAIRSLVASHQLAGTNEWLIIHHTECAFETFTNEEMGTRLKESLGSREGYYVNWLTIRDVLESIHEDVERIRNHPLVPKEISVNGYLYDVRTGRLKQITQVKR